jgi:hypothetical protein
MIPLNFPKDICAGSLSTCQYSILFRFFTLEDSAELADGHTGCVEMSGGGCLSASKFTVTSQAYVRRRSEH